MQAKFYADKKIMLDDGLPERLRLLIGEDSERKFARDVGVNDGTLRSILKGTRPSVDFVVAVAKAKGVGVGWLAAGEGNKFLDANEVEASTDGPSIIGDGKLSKLDRSDLVLVPVLDVHAAAGFGAVVEQEMTTGVMALEKSMLRDLGITSPGALRLLQSAGDSMYPTIRSGEWLLVDTGIDRVVNEGIYIFRKAGAVIVKRIKITLMGEVHLISDNGGSAEIISADDLPDLHAAGRVIWVFRAI